MSGQDDIKNLSEQFLDLWQKQLSASFKDQGVVTSMLEAMQTMQNLGSGNAKQTHHTATDLSEPGDDEILQLDKRIRACEERLDRLESSFKKKG